MKKIVLLAIMLIAFPAMSFAAIATGSISVTANVSAAGTCTVANTLGSFGNIVPPITANVDSQTNFAVTCPNQTPYTVALSTGNGGSYSPRHMGDGAQNLLAYNLYTDATYATVWGDGAAGTAPVAGVGNSSAQYLFPYMRIPPQATPEAGSYSDTVTITVTY